MERQNQIAMFNFKVYAQVLSRNDYWFFQSDSFLLLFFYLNALFGEYFILCRIIK